MIHSNTGTKYNTQHTTKYKNKRTNTRTHVHTQPKRQKDIVSVSVSMRMKEILSYTNACPNHMIDMNWKYKYIHVVIHTLQQQQQQQ